MRLVAWTIGATAAAAAVPLIGKSRKTWKAYRTLRAIDIRTVNTVLADAKRTADVPATTVEGDAA